MKLLQMACSIHGCQWNIINDFEEFDRLERKARKAFCKGTSHRCSKSESQVSICEVEAEGTTQEKP